MTAVQIHPNEDYLLARRNTRTTLTVRRKLATVHLRHAREYRDRSQDPYSPIPTAVSRSLMRLNARLWRFYTSYQQSVFGGGRPAEGASGGSS